MYTQKIVSLCLLVAFCSCKKEINNNAYTDSESVVIKDLPGDTSASMQNGGVFKSVYFSFKTGTAISISGQELKTIQWDIAFTGPYNSEVFLNNGAFLQNPGYEGAGRTSVVILEKPYQQVIEAPADDLFNASEVNKIGWDPGNGIGWFYYSLTNHIMVPIQNRTFAIRTNDGKYAKLELLNAYKGNPPVVTDIFWPAPYFTFRYFIQENGSRNLRTVE